MVDGRLTKAIAERIVEADNTVIREDGRLVAFHDWERAESYDTEARLLLTRWGASIARDVEVVHILFRSKLVAMGVSVAALVLGGMIHPHTTRASFEAARRGHR